VALLDEPKGWRILQAMAQRERDPQKLASIIGKMNRLLDHHERMAADTNSSASMSRNRISDNPIKLRLNCGSSKREGRPLHAVESTLAP